MIREKYDETLQLQEPFALTHVKQHAPAVAVSYFHLFFKSLADKFRKNKLISRTRYLPYWGDSHKDQKNIVIIFLFNYTTLDVYLSNHVVNISYLF